MTDRGTWSRSRRTRKRACLMKAGLAVGFVGLVACRPQAPPDEIAFRAIYVAAVVEGAGRAGILVDGSPKTILFDLDTSIPHEPEVKAALTGANIQWKEARRADPIINLGGGGGGGGGGSGRVPGGDPDRKHVFVWASIEGEGPVRTIEWSFTCGPLCGYGEQVEFRWREGAWARVRRSSKRF